MKPQRRSVMSLLLVFLITTTAQADPSYSTPAPSTSSQADDTSYCDQSCGISSGASTTATPAGVSTPGQSGTHCAAYKITSQSLVGDGILVGLGVGVLGACGVAEVASGVAFAKVITFLTTLKALITMFQEMAATQPALVASFAVDPTMTPFITKVFADVTTGQQDAIEEEADEVADEGPPGGAPLADDAIEESNIDNAAIEDLWDYQPEELVRAPVPRLFKVLRSVNWEKKAHADVTNESAGLALMNTLVGLVQEMNTQWGLGYAQLNTEAALEAGVMEALEAAWTALGTKIQAIQAQTALVATQLDQLLTSLQTARSLTNVCIGAGIAETSVELAQTVTQIVTNQTSGSGSLTTGNAAKAAGFGAATALQIAALYQGWRSSAATAEQAKTQGGYTITSMLAINGIELISFGAIVGVRTASLVKDLTSNQSECKIVKSYGAGANASFLPKPTPSRAKDVIRLSRAAPTGRGLPGLSSAKYNQMVGCLKNSGAPGCSSYPPVSAYAGTTEVSLVSSPGALSTLLNRIPSRESEILERAVSSPNGIQELVQNSFGKSARFLKPGFVAGIANIAQGFHDNPDLLASKLKGLGAVPTRTLSSVGGGTPALFAPVQGVGVVLSARSSQQFSHLDEVIGDGVLHKNTSMNIFQIISTKMVQVQGRLK